MGNVNNLTIYINRKNFQFKRTKIEISSFIIWKVGKSTKCVQICRKWKRWNICNIYR